MIAVYIFNSQNVRRHCENIRPKNACTQVAGFQLFSISPLDVRVHDCLSLRITETFGGSRVSIVVAIGIRCVLAYFAKTHTTK